MHLLAAVELADDDVDDVVDDEVDWLLLVCFICMHVGHASGLWWSSLPSDSGDVDMSAMVPLSVTITGR